MKERNRIGLWDKVIRGLYVMMGIVFLPVLFCVFFLDKYIKYNKEYGPVTLLPNVLLFVIALFGIAAVCMLAWALKKIELTEKINIITTIALALLFTLLYIVNVWIAREIAFKLPWDIMVVGSHASYAAAGNPIGYQYYFSIYTNNIPIVYILKKLYVWVMEMGDYPYVKDFIWIQANCVLLSLGGFFGCLTVKKLTRKLAPTVVCFLLYLALAGLTPWKMAPYTDTYGLAFPPMCIYFYLCYRETRKDMVKFLFIALALASAAVGGLIKPSIYILIIAVLSVECIFLLQDFKNNWKYVLAEIVLVISLFFIKDIYMDHMVEDIGLDLNEELGASWQHYFHMGQNGETFGSYSSDDATLFGEFQTSKRDRNKAALERALARIKERKISGNFSFDLGKMTMVFNEGTFGWANEAEIYENYPASLARNDGTTEFLRKIFWPNMPYTGRYNTFCQLIWIFCLVGMSGFCFVTEEKRKKYLILTVSFLGIFFYQLIFEARARYLMVFLPLLTAISICGMWQYAEWIMGWLQKKSFVQKKSAD